MGELPQIDVKLCTLCGACVAGCPQEVLALTPQGPVFVHPEACLYCADCEGLCPVGAIRCEFTIVGPETSGGKDERIY